jgi:hypothetical protein
LRKGIKGKDFVRDEFKGGHCLRKGIKGRDFI